MQQDRPGVRLRSVVLVISVLMAGAVACAPGPSTGPPVITSFSATRTAGPAPLTTTFTWTISDPDATTMSCSLDADGDDTYETQIPQCSSSVARTVTFDTPGTRTASLLVSDGASTVASAPVVLSVDEPSTDGFGITVRFDTSVTEAQKAVFNSSATRWSEVVRTGLPDVAVSVVADYCGTGAPAFDGTVDDLMIDASIVDMDGSGGVLGRAGPCLVRSGGGLPVYGSMEFDAADVADMVADGSFADVILHEMGHVLGIGTVWDGLVSAGGSSDPRFVGMAARGAFSAMFGGDAEPVPVEATGGSGTAGSHWRESVFGSELMTGWIGAGSNPLSRVTVGGLSDLGYGVDLGAADELPVAALRRPGPPERRVETQLIRPTGTVG